MFGSKVLRQLPGRAQTQILVLYATSRCLPRRLSPPRLIPFNVKRAVALKNPLTPQVGECCSVLDALHDAEMVAEVKWEALNQFTTHPQHM